MAPLQTPNLALTAAQLRSWRIADAPRLVEAWADIEIGRWNAVPPEPTIATAKRWISGERQRLDRRLSVDAVIEHGDHGVVGEVGLSGFTDRHRGALIGYWLLPAGRGQGLATEAVIACTSWAHQQLELDTIIARCDPANPASRQVAERAGFGHESDDATGHQLWIHRAVAG